MKKNKILIPALAVLAFSTVASVTSTVAWFSSVSAATVSSTSFQVTEVGGNLEIEYGEGVGTAKKYDTTDTSKVIGIQPKTYGSGTSAVTSSLTHGSFDHNSGYVYTANTEDTSLYVSKGDITVASPTETDFMQDATKKKFNAYTFKITFKYGSADNSGPNDYNRGLYFNSSGSSIACTPTLAAGTTNAGRGFRVAFISDDDSQKCVWSPETGLKYSNGNTPASGATATSYVKKSTSDTTGTKTAYSSTEYGSDGVLCYQGDGSAVISANETGSTTRKDYLGKFTSTNGYIVVTCVVWFEGCDDVNVVTGTSFLPSVDASMKFYVRKVA